MKCQAPSCDKESGLYKKYCSKHDGRLRRHNSLDNPIQKTYKQRFWEKVDKKSDNECWNWIASKSKRGYGYFYNGKKIKAHRYSWLIHNGEIPIGLFVCHHCDNPSCVNPCHLFLGTSQDNQIDAKNKGRLHISYGEQQPNHKLTRSDIQKIRERYATGKYTYFDLSKEFGVVFQHIAKIVRRQRWNHI